MRVWGISGFSKEKKKWQWSSTLQYGEAWISYFEVLIFGSEILFWSWCEVIVFCFFVCFCPPLEVAFETMGNSKYKEDFFFPLLEIAFQTMGISKYKELYNKGLLVSRLWKQPCVSFLTGFLNTFEGLYSSCSWWKICNILFLVI